MIILIGIVAYLLTCFLIGRKAPGERPVSEKFVLTAALPFVCLFWCLGLAFQCFLASFQKGRDAA